MINTSNRVSLFSDDWKLIFITKDTANEMFEPLDKNFEFESIFDKFGVAFSLIALKIIFIDVEQLDGLTDEHIFAIEAHEIGHCIAGHSKRAEKEDDEIEADRIAIEILQKNKLNESANFLIQRLEDKGIDYKKVKLKYKKELRQYIK